jgi:hypothetical protein
MSGNTVILLRSTDTGAPVLSGTAGALTALLDACLQDGYNAKTPSSITRSGAIATVTFATAHGYAPDGLTKVLQAGWTQAEYNGIFQISNVSTNAYDITVTGTPATPGTGSGTSKAAPLGWSKTYTGTNKAVYRGNEVTGTRLYLRVDDNNPHSNGYQSAKMVGYETMTDVDTGTGLFPTVAQLANGIYCRKSEATSSAAKEWLLVGDGFEFHFFMRFVPNCSIPVYQQFHFGDPSSEMASDPYGCLIYGSTSHAATWPYEGNETSLITTQLLSLSPQAGHYFARNYTQAGSSSVASKCGNAQLGGSYLGIGAFSYPMPHNNGLYIAPLFVGDNTVIRAQLKSIYQPLHNKPLGHGGVVAAANSPIGRRLYAVRTTYLSANNDGETHLDIDGPWR